ncbi:hypothetical protein ACLNBI_07110 [Pseudomonas guariconensis]|uniref:hypothetical protein n=1 Tax=Pseudomonas guariconensis TaxID=1288410 RepID=UPI0039E882A0
MTTLKEPPTENPVSVATVFLDAVYTSRVLILPDGRQLTVAKGRVCADPGDDVALSYLKKHPDLKPLPE